MTAVKPKIEAHPLDIELADYLSGHLSKDLRRTVETHLGACDDCLQAVISAREAVAEFNKYKPLKNRKDTVMKKLNIYLTLTIISFTLSFITPRFFIQLLVATLLLGMKWVVDSKTTKMLVMIHEAWKRDGGEGASRILETVASGHPKRF
jgi:hypothetical protein